MLLRLATLDLVSVGVTRPIGMNYAINRDEYSLRIHTCEAECGRLNRSPFQVHLNEGKAKQEDVVPQGS